MLNSATDKKFPAIYLRVSIIFRKFALQLRIATRLWAAPQKNSNKFGFHSACTTIVIVIWKAGASEIEKAFSLLLWQIGASAVHTPLIRDIVQWCAMYFFILHATAQSCLWFCLFGWAHPWFRELVWGSFTFFCIFSPFIIQPIEIFCIFASD